MSKQQTWHGPAQCQIKVKERLGKLCSEWFEGMIIVSDGGETTISGKTADQAALHGFPNRGREPPWLVTNFCTTE